MGMAGFSMQEGSGANMLLNNGLVSAAGWLQLHLPGAVRTYCSTSRNMTTAAGLTGIGTEPYFGIGQRAILVQTPEGALMAIPRECNQGRCLLRLTSVPDHIRAAHRSTLTQICSDP